MSRISAECLPKPIECWRPEGATPSAMRHAVPLARRTIHCPGRGSRHIVFLGTRDEFLELLASVGFTKIDCRNETSEASERRPGELAPATILGADMPERQANAARSGKEERLVRIFVIAQRPS